MKTSENLPQTDLPQMELPLTQSAEGSRARMQALRMFVDWVHGVQGRGFFLKRSDLLATWVRSSSWKMSQASWDGDLETFSGPWPKAGFMRNGVAYQLDPPARTTNGSVYGSWPTPNARDGKDLSRTSAYLAQRKRHSPSMATRLLMNGVPWWAVSAHYETSMGFPLHWSAVAFDPRETPSSRKSPNSSAAPSRKRKE